MEEKKSGYRKAFDKQCSSFLQMAVGTYEICTRPSGTADEFLETVYNPMLTDFSLDPVAMQSEFKKLQRLPDYRDFLRLACAYQIAAVRALDSNKGSKSLTFLCRANYYLGRTQEKAMLTIGVKRVIKRQRTAAAGSGGKGKADKRTPLIEYARKLAVDGGYTSQKHAAMRIVNPVVAKAKELGIPFDAEDPARSVERMLKGLRLGRSTTQTSK
ncbi:hypothetical protein [Paraburkholderia sp. MM5482-R1]|uniref:hypothetical protein n=1 Tax=unclassified Paraburkholderia TaxID=2615204 RepID=UPI003D1E3EDE